jgi:O-glycosyl hydrolase
MIKPAAIVLVLVVLFNADLYSQSGKVSMVEIDGARRFQTIDGFGVNINTAWWYDGEYRNTELLKPAIDLLVDSLGATIFRAVIEEIDWEMVNDNSDPEVFNWDYYNQVFSSPRFQGVWNTLRYLNQKGITDGLMISLMGGTPAAEPLAAPDRQKSWMGGTDYSVYPEMEDELVESIAALLYYARKTAGIHFSLVSPMNETDIISITKSAEHPEGIVEGPNMPGADQFARIIKKLGVKLDEIDMGDIQFVIPDAGGDRLFADCLEEMIKDPYTMSKLAHWGVHDYGISADNYFTIVSNPANKNKSFWVTEMAGIDNLFGQLDDGARSYIFWDGFDCVYQHARRNGYGDNPPNDWVFWFGPDEGKPLIEYVPATNRWAPRKHFYEFAQIYRFVLPGATRIESASGNDSLVVRSFLNPDGQLVIAGRNASQEKISMVATLTHLPSTAGFTMVSTSKETTFQPAVEVIPDNNVIRVDVPANSVFTLAGFPDSGRVGNSFTRPEPSDWFAGDMHVHRNCGEVTGIVPEQKIAGMMERHDLAVVSLLADMGNAEVKPSEIDLPKVTGMDAKESRPGRIMRWDAEWHFDPAGVTFEKKAIGGHLVLLGLKEAHQIWEEAPYKILEWARKQGAVTGLCHMQYLGHRFPDELDCCAPLDFPVEAALGTIDFLAEDVWLNDAAVHAYYKLLNCGFRLGWAAGTDFPCNNSEPIGSLLTYVQVKDAPLTYEKWIDGIKNGRTVVSLNGHNEFLDLKVNESSGPGDEISLKKGGKVTVSVKWTAAEELSGNVELVCNGVVVATQEGTARTGEPVVLKSTLDIQESSWICARRMNEQGHQSHTAPVYISVGGKPVRASAEDAEYFVDWIDNLIKRTSPDQDWNGYFTHDIGNVQNRYRQAKAVYQKIKSEAAGTK